MQNEQENISKMESISLEQYLLVKKENTELHSEVLYLKQDLAQLKRMIFGSKSKRHLGEVAGQLSLGLDLNKTAKDETVKWKKR
jgi:hypothetical protein